MKYIIIKYLFLIFNNNKCSKCFSFYSRYTWTWIMDCRTLSKILGRFQMVSQAAKLRWCDIFMCYRFEFHKRHKNFNVPVYKNKLDKDRQAIILIVYSELY